MTHLLDKRRTAYPIITLTTDFGRSDAYVASMKGVILGVLPRTQIVDITHEIVPQNIIQALYVLGRALPFFPRHTVHVAVVDPGVGTDRRPIGVFTDSARYIGPDNGIFTHVYDHENVKEVRLLSDPAYHLPVVSSTFHGRDIFAAVAAHVASGVPPHHLGPEVHDPIRMDLPEPKQLADGSISGQILYADHFGNLVSNIPGSWLMNREDWRFKVGGVSISEFHHAYGNVMPGRLVVLTGSNGLIEVAVRNGNAASRLNVSAGDTLRVVC